MALVSSVFDGVGRVSVPVSSSSPPPPRPLLSSSSSPPRRGRCCCPWRPPPARRRSGRPRWRRRRAAWRRARGAPGKARRSGAAPRPRREAGPRPPADRLKTRAAGETARVLVGSLGHGFLLVVVERSGTRSVADCNPSERPRSRSDQVPTAPRRVRLILRGSSAIKRLQPLDHLGAAGPAGWVAVEQLGDQRRAAPRERAPAAAAAPRLSWGKRSGPSSPEPAGNGFSPPIAWKSVAPSPQASVAGPIGAARRLAHALLGRHVGVGADRPVGPRGALQRCGRC